MRRNSLPGVTATLTGTKWVSGPSTPALDVVDAECIGIVRFLSEPVVSKRREAKLAVNTPMGPQIALKRRGCRVEVSNAAASLRGIVAALSYADQVA